MVASGLILGYPEDIMAKHIVPKVMELIMVVAPNPS